MKILLDTHIILWAANSSDELSKAAYDLLEDESNELYFSPASLWEITIKSALQKENFHVDARVLRRNLLDNDYIELPITSAHAVHLETLPPIHKDPFDRILIAQASMEGIILLTSDSIVAQYPGSIRQV